MNLIYEPNFIFMKSKRLILSLIALSLAVISSCKKDTINTETERTHKAVSTLPENSLPYNASYVVYENGRYLTNYAGGLSFGSTFVHPLSITADMNGSPFAPEGFEFDWYYGAPNKLSFTVYGADFVMVQGTVVGGMTVNGREAISKFNADWGKYLSGDSTVTSAPDFSSYANQYNTPVDGLITTTGRFVYDNASPTNISIVPLSYSPPGLVLP